MSSTTASPLLLRKSHSQPRLLHGCCTAVAAPVRRWEVVFLHKLSGADDVTGSLHNSVFQRKILWTLKTSSRSLFHLHKCSIRSPAFQIRLNLETPFNNTPCWLQTKLNKQLQNQATTVSTHRLLFQLIPQREISSAHSSKIFWTVLRKTGRSLTPALTNP